MFDRLMNTIYNSAYNPGPLAKGLAVAVGAYSGLVVASIVHHKLH